MVEYTMILCWHGPPVLYGAIFCFSESYICARGLIAHGVRHVIQIEGKYEMRGDVKVLAPSQQTFIDLESSPSWPPRATTSLGGKQTFLGPSLLQ